MKKALALLVFLMCTAGSAGAEPLLVGKWAYFMKVYQGQDMPEPPDAILRLRFEFQADGTSRLYWWHEGENYHCERRGLYYVEGSELVDEVVWVNPANSYGCDRDPDMQQGRLTRTAFSIRDGNLRLQIPFAEEELTYVWKRVEEEGK
ncbi:MAG TPA: hypothetical protein VIH99_04140 [Bdellovibrionota bacterium]|jgi:hypothetical protein